MCGVTYGTTQNAALNRRDGVRVEAEAAVIPKRTRVVAGGVRGWSEVVILWI